MKIRLTESRALPAIGIYVYAAAFIGFGLVGIVTGQFLNALQPVPAGLPGYLPLAYLNGALLASAGILLVLGGNARNVGVAVSIYLGTWILLLHVPSAFTQPELLRSPWWIRTFETLALSGAALVAAGVAGERQEWIRTGRVMFGISLPVFGILHFVYAANVASLIPDWYPWRLFLAYLTGAGHFAAGLAIASGMLARPAALFAGTMYAIWALTLHLPRVIWNPAGYNGDRQEFTSLFVCIGFWGAAWLIAGALSGPPKPAMVVIRANSEVRDRAD